MISKNYVSCRKFHHNLAYLRTDIFSMEFKYKKIKKLDIKKWLQGGNSKIYLIILVVFLAAVIFALTSIKELSKNSQSNNNITQSDESDNNKETSAFVENNLGYKLRVNKSQNFITVYKKDSSGEFKPLSVFACSVNSNVNTGDTVISNKQTWSMLASNTYGHYTCILGNGAYIHSVPYWSQNVKQLNVDAYNRLGITANTGSIYLQAKDAKWIYENCGVNIPVEIYEDANEKALLDYKIPDKLAAGANYDPSDTEALNANINGKIDYMSGVKNCQIALNQPFDKWEGIYAVDTNGNNITSSITISGNVDVTKPGVYTLIYYLSDNFGTDLAYYRYVTVGEGETSNAADNNNNKQQTTAAPLPSAAQPQTSQPQTPASQQQSSNQQQ